MASYATLYEALRRRDRSALEQQITDTGTANAHNTDGRTLLHDAIALGLPDFAALLLERGAALTRRHALGGTPLHSLAWAVRHRGYPARAMLTVLNRWVPSATLERIVGDVVPAHSLSTDPRLNIEVAYHAVNRWVEQIMEPGDQTTPGLVET